MVSTDFYIVSYRRISPILRIVLFTRVQGPNEVIGSYAADHTNKSKDCELAKLTE